MAATDDNFFHMFLDFGRRMIRDHLMAFQLSPKVSTQDPISRGLILNKNSIFHIFLGFGRKIIRDYLTAFWLSPEVSTRDPITSRRALDNKNSVL